MRLKAHRGGAAKDSNGICRVCGRWEDLRSGTCSSCKEEAHEAMKLDVGKRKGRVAEERVALFVDGGNMFYAQMNNGWFIDWEKAYRYFGSRKKMSGAFYFTAYPPASEIEKIGRYHAFRKALIYSGYNVIDKEVKVLPDKIKGNMDVEIAFRLLTEIDRYDELVFFGGDSDFVVVFNHLKNLGKKILCVGRPDMTSLEIRNVVTAFHDLNDLKKHLLMKERRCGNENRQG